MADSVGQIGLDLVVNRSGFDKQMAGIQSIAKKAGLALAAAFSVKKLIDFGKESIELGSRLAEVDNVIQQAVPSMEKQIDSFAKTAIEQFGMSETSAKRFTGVFASMARGFGFSEKAAASMGTTLTGLAADVASFYDTSIDEAYTKLKSVFTGETETLKDLGIVMTQSALDAYALANGYGKTTKAMSEAEKVALRYAYVQEQLRFAEGDFARTSGNWANQVRILTEQFNALKATIGQGLINVLTPVIQVINTIISKLMSLANAFKAFTELLTGNKGSSGGATVKAAADMEAVASAADNASGAIGGTGGAAKKAAKDIKGMTTGIDELNIINPDSGSGGGGSGGGGAGGYNADEFDMGELDTSPVDELDSKYAALIERMRELGSLFLEGFKIGFGDTSVLESIKGHLDGIKESLKNIFADKDVLAAGARYADALALNLGKVAGSVASIGATIADNLLGGIDKYLKQNNKRIKNYLISIFDISAETAKIAGEFSEAFAFIFSAFRSEDAKQITADIIAIFGEIFMGLNELAAKLGRDVLDALTAPFIQNKDLFKSTIEDTLSTIQPTVESIKLIVQECFEKLNKLYDQHVRPMIQAFRDGFTKIAEKILEVYNQYILPVIEEWSKRFEEFRVKHISPLIDKFMEFGGKVADAITLLWQEILLPFILWFIENVAPYIQAGLQLAMDMFFFLAETVGTVVSGVLDFLEGLIDFIVGVFTGDWGRAWDGIKQMLSAIWETMKSLVSLAIEFVSDKIQSVLSAIGEIWDTGWTIVKDCLKTTWDNMKRNVETLFNKIKTFISTTIDNIKQFWSEKWNAIKDKASEIWTNIKDKASEIFEAIKEKLAEIWDKIKETIEEKWNAIKEWFGETWQAIKDVFKLDEMLEVGRGIMTKLWDGLIEVWSSVKEWLSGVLDWIGNACDSLVDGAINIFKKKSKDAEDEADDDDGGGKGVTSTGQTVTKGHATGGFPRSGSLFVANEDGNPEMVGSWGGKAAVANNMQITEGITRAVQFGMRSAIAPLVNNMTAITANAAPPLAMVGSAGSGHVEENQIQDMVSRAVAMSQQENMSDHYLGIMVDLLKKIIELIENLDLVINIDIREIRKKLKDLEERSGYSFT